MASESQFIKRVYFVRHGESHGNVTNLHGDHSHALTPRGQQQAEFIASRCEKLKVEALLSSDMVRAQETAQAIARRLKLPIETSEFFHEALAPTVLRNKPRTDPQSLEMDTAIRTNFGVSGFRLSDEENFEDLKARALHALGLLAKRPEENILVVTHGFFLRIVVACAIFGPDLNARECLHFIRTLHMENTGLTILGYDPEQRVTPWWLWVWNDHAHLAD